MKRSIGWAIGWPAVVGALAFGCHGGLLETHVEGGDAAAGEAGSSQDATMPTEPEASGGEPPAFDAGAADGAPDGAGTTDAGATADAKSHDALPSCDFLLEAGDECAVCAGQHCCSRWQDCIETPDCLLWLECENPEAYCTQPDGSLAPCDAGCDDAGANLDECCADAHAQGLGVWDIYLSCVQNDCSCAL